MTRCREIAEKLPRKEKEYELTYEGKEWEEDILADTMVVPLQLAKTFGNPERDQRSYEADGYDEERRIIQELRQRLSKLELVFV